MSLQLLYFANPMCSWCWGFSPTARALAERGYPLTLALGSLGADRARPMRDKDKATMRGHWQHVAARSGQAFDFGFFAREGFVYDTEPPSRAVAIVRASFPALALSFLGRLQERFYALGQDITDPLVLREAAGEFAIGPEAFDAAFNAPESAASVAAEWRQTAELGVGGYPTLLALGAGKPRVVALGWRKAEAVLAELADIEGKIRGG